VGRASAADAAIGEREVQQMRMKSVLVLCAALALTVGLGTSSASAKPQTIRLLEADTSFVPTGGWSETSHVPPAIGQGFAFGGILYKWAGAKRGTAFGHIAAMCSVATKTHMLCNGALFLPGGMIELLAPAALDNEAPLNIPVVGGTGAYVGAQGYMRTMDIGGENSNKSSLVIHLL
jgi:hypothetical protein